MAIFLHKTVVEKADKIFGGLALEFGVQNRFEAVLALAGQAEKINHKVSGE